MADSSFRHKRLQFMIVFENEDFGDKKNTVVLEGYRASVTIDLAGVDLGMSHMACRIWGVPKHLMDLIDTRGNKTDLAGVQPMNIKIAADDGCGQFVDVYIGHVIYAFPDYNAAPNAPIEIQASSANRFIWDAPAASSYKGEFDVATAIEGLAKRMGFAFENAGVTEKLSNQYVWGSTLNQIRTLARAARVVCLIANQKVKIWPNGKTNGYPVLKLSPQTGLIGYPRWEHTGITITHLFNQNIVSGTEVQLDTSIEAQQGRWYVHMPIRHMLDAEMPNGKWQTEARLFRSPEGQVRVN
jgi:hypothetical protein